MSGGTVRVALIDDHTLFRESLSRLLEAEQHFQVVAQSSTAEEGLRLAEGTLPIDLALIDYELGEHGRVPNSPVATGLDVLRAMRQLRPTVHCMMVTAGIGTQQVRDVVGNLHASLFLKSEPAAELLLAIEKTMRNQVWVSSAASLEMLRGTAEGDAEAAAEVLFSTRELAVLGFVTQGLANKEIAGELQVTESSVKAMLQKLFAKTSVRSRAQLVRFVFESELQLP